MALGDQNNYSNNSYSSNRTPDTTYYSRLHFDNYKEYKRISVTFSAGLLSLTISKKLTPDSRFEDSLKVNLTGYKASLMLKAIEKFEENFKKIGIGVMYAVSTGISETSTVLGIHKTPEDTKAITIATVDKAGKLIKREEYNFPVDNDFYLNFSNFDAMNVTNEYDNELQYNMFKQMLTEFSNNYSGAAGYLTVDLARYDIRANTRKVESIMDKLGVPIQRRSNNVSYNNSGNNYFNNNNNSSSNFSRNMNPPENHKSIDELLNSDDD